MQRPNFFLRTKLLPPRPVLDLLSRPRLTRRLHENLNAPITLVTANAGCGKTTLVAEFIRGQSRQVIWYQLDHTDADPFVFLGYICYGIKQFAPAFGETILPYLNEANEELLRFPERAVDLLLNEILDGLEQPFILVLDDYHHIGRETIVHKLVDRLLQYSSDMLHLIITTRDLPPLAIVRRRSQSAALVITRDDLLFTDEETRDLFRTTLNIELKPEELAEYREKTHGWVTALQLVRQVAEGSAHGENSSPVDLREMLRQSEKDIFDYFAEEVFAGEQPEIQQSLMSLSLLDELPLNLSSQIFPDMRSSAILPALVQRNVFVTVASDGTGNEVYRFHPLFRDFLLRRLRTERGRSGVAAERTRIAQFFMGREQWEKALSFLLEAENYDKAAEVIAKRGSNWIKNGAITSLGFYAGRVPREFLEKYPQALVNMAEVSRLQGDIEKTITLLHRAVKLLHEELDSNGEAEALHALASIARQRGQITQALELLEQAEKLVGETSEVRMKCENTRGLCFLAQDAWANAERQFRFALELAEKLSNEQYIRLIINNLALPYGLRGDFGEALRWLQRLFSEGKPESQLPQDSIAHYNVAQLHLYRGELSDAEPHLNRALELCQLYNLRARLGEILEAYGNLYREKLDFAHAAEFYERARKAYEEAGIDLSVRELFEEQAELSLRIGDIATAQNLLKNLREKREQKGNQNGLMLCRLALCRIALANDETNLVPELKAVLDYFHERNYYCYEAQASLLLAAAYFAENRRLEMLPPLQRTLDLAARFDYDYWLRVEITRHPDLFANDAVIEFLPPDLRSAALLEREKLTKNELPNKVQNDSEILQLPVSQAAVVTAAEVLPVVDLVLKLLGHAEIYRDLSNPFSADAWTTRRARDIFCYIATSRHRRVDKDVLIEAFWGDADFNAIEKNFHPTISHIRKALNSRQALKQNFLVYRDGAYQLNPQLTYSIDTEEFETLISEAEAAVREGNDDLFRKNLTAAHALYRGEFLTGVYENWAEERRVYFSEQFARVLNGLAKIAFKEKNWGQTLKYANEILRQDPYREDLHRLAMRVYSAQGKRGKVKEHFEHLRETLKRELGVEPAPETNRLFHDLFK